MTTPLIMLLLMAGPWLTVRLAGRTHLARPAGAWGLGLLFAFTGTGHFLVTEPMAAMLPAWVPWRVGLVLLSGAGELVLAVLFLVPRTRRLAGWLAAALLVAFFPVNVYAAAVGAPVGGHAWGLGYLWIRGPLQLAILLWVWWFAIRHQPGRIGDLAGGSEPAAGGAGDPGR